MGTKWWRTIATIASKGNFDLLLHLARVGIRVDSSEHKFALGVSSRGSSVKMDARGSRVLRERRLNSMMKTKRSPGQRGSMTLVYLRQYRVGQS